MREMKLAIRFGPVVLLLRFSPEYQPVAQILARWLAAGAVTDETIKPNIVIVLNPAFDDRNETGSARTTIGDSWLEGNHFGFWDKRAWECELQPPLPTSGQIIPTWLCRARDGMILRLAKRVPTIVLRLAHQHYFSYQEMLASTLLYRLIIPAVQLALVKMNCSLVHASAVHDARGNALLLCGWGGTGKTSASTQLYLQPGAKWQYLSDDLAIVSGDGRIYFSPIPLNIFPYNTSRFQELERRLLGNMGKLDRLHWRARARLLGPSSVARRIAPLQAQPLIDGARLSWVVGLQRSSMPDIRISACQPSVVAGVAKNVLLYELRHAWPFLLYANAYLHESSPTLPSPDALALESEAILGRAFRMAAVARMDIPSRAGGTEVSRTLESYCDESSHSASVNRPSA